MEHNGLGENEVTLVWKIALRRFKKQGKGDDKGRNLA